MSKTKTVVCSDPEMDRKWQAEADARLLMSASEVLKDKDRLSAAKKYAKKQMQELQSLLKDEE